MGTELMKAFEFETQAVRVVERDGDPWFVAKDVAEALGYTWNGMQRIEHVPEKWRGVTSVVTPSGTQEMAVLSEQGLYWFLARSDKQSAFPFQEWIAGEVVPSIRKTGQYAIQPKTQAEMLLMWAQQAVDQERRVVEVEQRLQTIEKRAVDSTIELRRIPEPDIEAGEVSTRKLIGRVVRSYCLGTGVDFGDAYRALYREYRDRFGVDLAARARNRNRSVESSKDCKPLDIAEELGIMDQLYAVAHEVFVSKPIPTVSAEE